MFNSIIINKENFPKLNLTLSTMRTAKDSEENEFNYYWITLNGIICCTGRKFTELLGKDASDDKAAEVIKENAGKFQISQATDDDGDPIYINGEPDKPLLRIQAVAHYVTVDW